MRGRSTPLVAARAGTLLTELGDQVPGLEVGWVAAVCLRSRHGYAAS
jgi:hypothetical protein